MSDIVIHGLDDIKDKITINLYPGGEVQDMSPFGKKGLSYTKIDGPKKEKALLIIDVQNDFVTGSLGSENAENVVVPNIVELVKQFNREDIYATLDTHFNNTYLKTQEGKKLPIKHCIKGTSGHYIVDELDGLIPEENRLVKQCFGVDTRVLFDTFMNYKEVHICGLVTDICVITNALAFKSNPHMDNINVIVHGECCGGTSKEAHDAALTVMRSCQIDVV